MVGLGARGEVWISLHRQARGEFSADAGLTAGSRRGGLRLGLGGGGEGQRARTARLTGPRAAPEAVVGAGFPDGDAPTKGQTADAEEGRAEVESGEW